MACSAASTARISSSNTINPVSSSQKPSSLVLTLSSSRNFAVPRAAVGVSAINFSLTKFRAWRFPLGAPAQEAAAAASSLVVGNVAPDFEAEVVFDQEFVKVKLSEYIGKKYVILFFYPLNFTFVGPTALRGLFIVDKEGIIQHSAINNLAIGRSVDETLRTLQALQYVQENPDEVCPAGWKPGEKSMKPDPKLSKEYLAVI